MQAKTQTTRMIGSHLRNRLLSGLFALVPLVITLLVLRFVAGVTASLLRPFVRMFLGAGHPVSEVVISLVGVVVLIYLVGLITAHILGRRVVGLGDSIMLRVPVVRSIYSASKQMVDMFRTSTRANFKSVVMVPFPNASVRSVGFVTGTSVDKAGRRTYRVFVPTTPNPTTGFFLLVDESHVEQTGLAVDDAIRLIMSGGMLAPEPVEGDGTSENAQTVDAGRTGS
jgi:uncharacterized membrane protein